MRDDLNLLEKLAIVRKYTGNRFSAARGYDGRKKMSRARARTISKYYEMIIDLTDRPHKIFTPKRGEKRETFSFTGQIHAPKFVKAIVVTPTEDGKFKFFIDKTRPKGSRFTIINKKSGEKSWHIPAKVFTDLDPHEDRAYDSTFYEYVLNEYAEQGEHLAYMIEAGEHHMWGAAGNIPLVAKKLAELFEQYGDDIFDRHDKNSHHIKNWFRGVQVFGRAQAEKYIDERAENRAAYIADFNRKAGRTIKYYGVNFRVLKSGDIGEFHSGKLVHVHKPLGGKKSTRRKTGNKKRPVVRKRTITRRRQ